MRNTIAQIFIHEYAELIQSDNIKEFTNKIHNTYLTEIEVIHLYGSPYHLQNQGKIEVFNKRVQKSLSAAYENEKDERMDWDLEINLFSFLNFFYC